MRAKTVNESMSPKDLDLIDKASQMDCVDWGIVNDMAEEADTDEARKELTSMSRIMYHNEEGKDI